MGAWDDDDDWVGEPPEGRHTRDRANPAFWRDSKPITITAAGIGLAVLILLIVVLLG